MRRELSIVTTQHFWPSEFGIDFARGMVDHDPDMRIAMRSILEDEGLNIRAATAQLRFGWRLSSLPRRLSPDVIRHYRRWSV